MLQPGKYFHKNHFTYLYSIFNNLACNKLIIYCFEQINKYTQELRNR